MMIVSVGVIAVLIVAILVLAIGLIRARRHAEVFQNIFEKASVGMVHVAMDGTWMRVNDKLTEITGYSRDELRGMRYEEITIDDDLEENRVFNARLRAGEIDSFVLQKRYRRQDERIIWVKLSVTLLRGTNGKPDYYISVIEDIDDLKRAEFEVEEQEARFQAFWNNSPFNQTIKDPQGRLIEVNDTYRRNYGLSDSEIKGRTSNQAHGTKWGSEIDDFDREVLRTRTTRTADFLVPSKDDTETYIRVTKFPVFDREGDIAGVGGVSFDITNQIRSAQDIRENEERFRSTFEQAAVGIAHVALDGTWLRMNQRYCDIVGYTEDELRQLTFRDITDSEDLETDLGQREKLIADGTGSYTREKRYIRKDGTPVWAEVTASLTQPSKEREQYLIAVVEEISDRKVAEQALAARLDQQVAVMKIGNRALIEQDLDALLTDTAATVANTLDVDVCLMSRYLHESGEFQIIATNETGQEFVGMRVQPQTQDEERSFAMLSSESLIFDNSDPAQS